MKVRDPGVAVASAVTATLDAEAEAVTLRSLSAVDHEVAFDASVATEELRVCRSVTSFCAVVALVDRIRCVPPSALMRASMSDVVSRPETRPSIPIAMR